MKFCQILILGAAYICTEDAFPNRRLMQMVQLLKDRATDPVVKNHNFTDHIYIEHVSDLVMSFV